MFPTVLDTFRRPRLNIMNGVCFTKKRVTYVFKKPSLTGKWQKRRGAEQKLRMISGRPTTVNNVKPKEDYYQPVQKRRSIPSRLLIRMQRMVVSECT